MSQNVKIECSTCEDILDIEFKGCVVIGYIDKEIHVWRHDVTLENLYEMAGYLKGLADGIKEGEKET